MDYFSKFILKRKEEAIADIKYYTLYYMTAGNQWTMVSDLEMNKLKNIGYMVEVFGSPFNTRLKWFGSLYESDAPFGRLGTYKEIIENLINEKSNKVVKIVINPPSGDLLITELCKNIFRLLDARKVEIRLFIPAKNDKYINIVRGKYFISSQIEDKAYDLYTVIDMRGREWYNILLRS